MSSTSEVKSQMPYNLELTELGSNFRFPIIDKIGQRHHVHFFWLDKENTADMEPGIEKNMDRILLAGQKAFPHYTEKQLTDYIEKKIYSSALVSYTTSYDTDQVTGFQLSTLKDLPNIEILDQKKAKVLYFDQVGTPQEYQGRGIAAKALGGITDIVNPHIIATSTANAAMLHSARRVAVNRMMEAYPKIGENTPQEILQIANRLYDVFPILSKATLDERMVRTYPSKVSPTQFLDPLMHEQLQLNETQHVFLLAINPHLHNKLVK